MPLNLGEWANIAAIISAMTDVIKTGQDTFTFFYNQRRNSPENLTQAQILSSVYSVFSDREIKDIEERIENCRDMFISQGGKYSSRCLCAVLNDVKDGNGGQIPVEEWEKIYNQLNCN